MKNRKSAVGEGAGAVIILFVFLPIKLMIDKYNKDGFFGLIKAIVAIILFVWFLIGIYYIKTTEYDNNPYGRIETGISDYIRDFKQTKKETDESLKSIQELSVSTASAIKNRVEIAGHYADIARADEYLKKIENKIINQHLPLIASFFIALYLSIKLYKSSCKRSRELKKANAVVVSKEE